MKQLIFVCAFLMISYCALSQSKAEEVCAAINKYFSEVEKGGQLDRIKGSLFAPAKYNGTIAQEFSATENFPLAQTTTLVDTSQKAGNPYRKIKALMLKETLDSDGLSANMQKIFSAFDIAFRNCLLPQKYNYVGPADQVIKLHKAESSFTKSIGRGYRTDEHLHANIYVEQTKKEDKYIHELYIVLSRG
ncbi:MAG: hypothetical protein V4557_14120 [Bacteroidota bacterium]